MLRITRWTWLPAVVVAGLMCAGSASAQLRDEAELFKNPQKISQAIKDVERQSGKTVLIETSASVPSGDVARVKAMYGDKDNDGLNRYFSDLAKTNAKRNRVDGLYILINKTPRWLEIVTNSKTDPLFPLEKRRELRQKITPEFKEKRFDEGMLAGLAYIRDQLGRASTGKAAGVPAPIARHVPEAAKNPQGEVNWGGIICVGLVVIAVIWLVIGMIRALTRPRGGYGGGPGYAGGPGYGGGYGGGGGGFMTGLLGGMFGAVAGNWLYHNMFGGAGGGHTGWGSQAYGGESSPNPQGGDEYTSTGGTWDDNAGGGDQGGGGGGDWGGGGDAGGGGDWGGGGGGDWGGGGGGDWGGGGGDFGGGGGGGGDW